MPMIATRASTNAARTRRGPALASSRSARDIRCSLRVRWNVNRRTVYSILAAAALLDACGPGHPPPSQSPEPVYPGSGDFDADGTADVRDQCPRDPGPPDNGGCASDVQPDVAGRTFTIGIAPGSRELT